jgi:hypothetical protein
MRTSEITRTSACADPPILGFLQKEFQEKQIFPDNRTVRNREYVAQRKHDFAVSQERVRCARQIALPWPNQTHRHSSLRQRKTFPQGLCDAVIALTAISDAFSFPPDSFSSLIKRFHAEGVIVAGDSPYLPEFWSRDSRNQLRRAFT